MGKKSTGAILLVGKATNCPDMVYATGFRAIDPVVLAAAGRRKILVVPAMEVGRARAEAKGRVEVVSPRELELSRKNEQLLSGWADGALRRLGTRRAIVSPFFPFGVARALEKRGRRLTVARAPLFPGRQRKSAGELAMIRQSQRAAVSAMKAVVAAIAAAKPDRGGFLRSGGRRVTSESLQLLAEQVMLRHGCASGETIVAGGRQGAEPHMRGSGPLRAGEPVVIDIFPHHLGHGYYGDLTRTVVRGRASARVRRMHAAVLAAQRAAMRVMRAGASVGRVHRAAAAALAKRGFKTTHDEGRHEGFIHATGHGVGLEVHEGPRLYDGSGRLKAGHVVTVEPGLYYAADGGMRMEDLLVVTKRGCRVLAECPRRLQV